MEKKSMVQLQKLIRDKKIDYKNSRKIFDEIIKKNPTKLEYKRSYAEQLVFNILQVDVVNGIKYTLKMEIL